MLSLSELGAILILGALLTGSIGGVFLFSSLPTQEAFLTFGLVCIPLCLQGLFGYHLWQQRGRK